MEVASLQTYDGNHVEMSVCVRDQIKSNEMKFNADQVPVPKDLKELVSNLKEVFSHDYVNVEYVTKLMENYKSNAKDWRQYAKYDPHKYTRNLIDEGNGKYNILLLCWAESQGSSIHDHSNAHCFMKCLDGELLETKYDWPTKSDDGEESEMKEKCKTIMKKNDVCYINDSIGLHRVENTSHSRPAISLHVYIPPYSECKGFDQHTGKARTCKIAFYSKYGSKVAEN